MTTYSIRFYSFRDKKISLSHTIIITLILTSVILWQANRIRTLGRVPRTVVQQSNSCPPPAIIQYNMSDYRYTKPLLLSEVITDRDNNDSKLNNIKDGIINIIDENKSSGIIHTASVYLRELASGGFISINDNEYYHPASLAKVPKLMAILRQSETTPGLLNKEIYVTQFPQESGVSKPRNQVFAPGKSIQIGKKYTIKELLYYTIVESDNNANLLLDNYWNENIFAQLFTDLGLTSPYSGPNQGLNYTLSASEYSRFMRVLYNATYLSNEDADYALSLLAQSEFKEGILKALPAGTMAAHKFGEYGHLSEDGEIIGNYELHESAIIYINNDPILLTIMTKGKNSKALAPVIAEIAKYVYDHEVKPAS